MVHSPRNGVSVTVRRKWQGGGALGALLLLHPAAVVAQTSEVAAEPTFLSGAELAERALNNVVMIASENDRGAGFVIGGVGESLLIATARHVLIPRGHTTFVGATVAFCSDQQQSGIAITPADVAIEDEKADVMLLRVARPSGYEPLRAVLGTAHAAVAGATLWSVGRDSECKVGSVTGGVDAAADETGNLQIDLPSGLGGTSGSPVLTEYGIVGMPLRATTQTKVIARSAQQIIELSRRIEGAGWRVSEAANFPPTSFEAMQLDLTKILNDYIFCLKDVRDALLAKSYRGAELTNHINAYNKAVNAYKQARDKYDGAIVRHVGASAYSSFGQVRSQIDAIHQEILGLNASMDKLRALQDRVPNAIRRTMQQLSPRVDRLDTNIGELIQALKEGQQNGSAAR